MISVFIVFSLEVIFQFSVPDKAQAERGSFTGLRVQRSWGMRPNPGDETTAED